MQSPVRIVHLSDLQTDDINAMHHQVTEHIKRFDPHIIAFTGDVLNHPYAIPAVTNFLNRFRKEAQHTL